MALILLFNNKSIALDNDTITIKSSVKCLMCKQTIEKGLSYKRGIISSTVDVDSKTIKIIYNPSIIAPYKIKKLISKMGYDADEIKRYQRTYLKLPACCQSTSCDDR